MTSVYDGVKREIDDLKAKVAELLEANHHLHELLAERASLLAEIARLNTWIDLHRGDTLSLDNDARIFMEQRDEADALWRSAEKTIANLTDVVLDITRQRDEAEAEIARLNGILRAANLA